MTDQTTAPIMFRRMPLTTPCPVPVTADGRSFGEDGMPLPMEERPQLCAVEAGWLIGAQRLCDYHVAEMFANGLIEGTLEDLFEEAYAEWPGAAEEALEKARIPWARRKRNSQKAAREWAKTARAHGLA